MMLWYKMWLESRVRFLLCVVTSGFLCVMSIARARTGFPPPELPGLTYGMWVWANNYGNFLPVVFVVMAFMLGLGGLQRERASGTAAFTLALFVTRVELVAARAAVGLLEIVALASIPALLIPTLSPPLAGQSYPFSQALQYALLFVTWGAVAFAVGFLWSTLLAGEDTAAALCILTPVAYKIIAGNSVTLRRSAADYSFFMSGGLANFNPKRTSWTGLYPGLRFSS